MPIYEYEPDDRDCLMCDGRVAVIQGSNERNAPGGPQVTIRDLKLGAELAKATKDRADYLELRKRAQFSAPEAELVERVREVLARV